MIKRLIPIILISILNIGEVRAEDQKVITLDEVFKSVENTYPSVIISKKDRLIADHKLLASQGSFDTVFNAKGEARPLGYYQNGSYDVYVEQPTTLWGSNFFSGLKIGGGKYATYEGKNETNDLGEIRTGFEIPLLKDGITDRRRTNIIQAEIKQYESDMKIIKKLIESKQNASQKYWKWVSTGQIYKIQEDIFNIAQNRDKSLLESSKLGQIANIESVENKRVIFQRQSSLVSAERSLQTAAMDLSIYLRNTSGETLVPELVNLPTKIEEISILSKIDLNKDIERAINNNPEIKIIQAMIKQAESELKYLENQNLPEIDFSLAISQDFGKGSKTREPAVLDTGIILKAPLQMRSAKGKFYEQETIIEQLRIQEKFLKDQIKIEVKNAYYSLKASYQQLELAKKELKLALELEKSEKDKFELGDSNILFINIREQATADARIREVTSKINYNTAIFDYKASLSEI